MAIKFLSAIDHGAYQLPTADGSNGQVLTTDGNGNVTFQSVSASTNYYLSGASFNTSDGVLTLTVTGATNQTVDLDGRYALSSHSHNYDNYGSWNLKTNGTQRTTVQSGGDLNLVAGSNVSLSYSAGGTVTITSTDTNTNTTYSAGSGLTLTGTTFAHSDTSTLSGAYGGNNNGIVIEDITVDSNGHVTAVGTRDLDGRFATPADVQEVNDRIDNEVIPAIPTDTGDLTNGAGYITNSVTDFYVADQILHTGDTDTYMQFHAADQWRVVTGGAERLEVNNTATTVANTLTASGGINGLTLGNGGISGTNFNITGVNQLEIADPGEGIVFTSGASGNMTLAIVDDASDNILNFSGTGATLQVNGATVATQSWVAGQGFVTSAITSVSTSAGLDGTATSGAVTISLDLSELTDMTVAVDTAVDELILLDNGAERRKRFAEIFGSAAYQNTSAFDAAGSAAQALADAISHSDQGDSDVASLIPTDNSQLTNGAGYITAVPSSFSTNSIAIGSTVTLTESSDRADLLYINSSTSSWGGLQIGNTSNEFIFSLMGDGTTGGIYDDQNADWLIQWTENAGVRLYHNAGQKLTTTSTGITITGEIATTGGNSTNWNTAYGWGDHAAVGYLTSFTETDPVFSASAAAGITSTNISNWNTAYGWGDHAAAGYVTSSGNTIIGTDSDIITSGATVIDDIYMTDGVITSHSTRTLTLANLGYTGSATADEYGGWRISDGSVTEVIASGDTLIVTGAGATGVSYDAGTNVLEISSSDTNTDTNYYLNGITKSGNTLTFSVSGATNQSYTFGSNAFTSYSNHTGLYDTVGSAQAVNDRIDTEIIPSIDTKLDASVNPIKGATVSNDTITFTRSDNTTFSVTTSDANTWRPIDSTPTNGATGDSISSDWAYDNVRLFSNGGQNLAGSFTATGDITAFSDIRVKENIQDLEGSLDKVSQLRGVSYNKIGSEEKSIGVIAQEIKEVLPEVVKEGEDGMLSVAYGNITAVLIEAIKEQQDIISQLEERIVDLENRI